MVPSEHGKKPQTMLQKHFRKTWTVTIQSLMADSGAQWFHEPDSSTYDMRWFVIIIPPVQNHRNSDSLPNYRERFEHFGILLVVLMGLADRFENNDSVT